MMGTGQGYADLTAMVDWAYDVMNARHPDFIIGPGDPDYIRRWWIIPRNESLNQYLHLTQRSDDDRALHDHPWPNTSFVLEGGYWEIMPEVDGDAAAGPFTRIWRGPGSVITREATAAHRLEIEPGVPAISLFATGPKVREWGFHCPNGWRHWKDFTGFNASGNSASVGKGCE